MWEDSFSKLINKLLNREIFKKVLIGTCISLIVAVILVYMIPRPGTLVEMFKYLFNDFGKYIVSIIFTFTTSLGLAWLAISIICSFENIRELMEYFIYIDEDFILKPNLPYIITVISLIILSFYFLSCAFKLMLPFIIIIAAIFIWAWLSANSK